MSGYVYLASPYTHPDAGVKEQRYMAAVKAAAKLMRGGRCVFAPIPHSHEIDKTFTTPMPLEFWKKQDIAILQHAEELAVLMLPGWEESAGVQWEIGLAKSLNIPVTYMEPIE